VPYKNLGYRDVQFKAGKSEFVITEYPVQKA
jgi:hypothetical protein